MRSIFDDSPEDITAVRAKWSGCSLCVFSSMWKETGPCLPLADITNAEVVVVGQWPGEQDMENKAPFSGKQGQVSMAMLEATGFPRKVLYPTNVLLCACPMEPTRVTLANCKEQLDETLDVVNPVLIIALGRHAAARLGFKKGIKQIRGTHRSYRRYTVVACTHPAAINRAKSREAKAKVEQEVISDLNRSFQLYHELKQKRK